MLLTYLLCQSNVNYILPGSRLSGIYRTMHPKNVDLSLAIEQESQKFQQCYLWLEKAMPAHFFEEVPKESLMLITHALMGFDIQEYFCTINLKRAAIVICLDGADADLKILGKYSHYGIKNYLAFVSNTPPPFPGITVNIRIGVIYFTEAVETVEAPYPQELKEELRQQVKHRNPRLTDVEFEALIAGINRRFLKALSMERLILALNMFFRAKTRDSCQYEVRYEDDWKETHKPSLQIVLAWKNAPKFNFLNRLALIIQRHGLVMKGVNATYIDPYSKDTILMMALSLHGAKGEAAWEAANIPDFLRELVTVKYFASFDIFETKLISLNIIPGVMGNLLRAMKVFIHQALVHVEPNLYSLDHIEEGLIRHPDLTQRICEAFRLKFHPQEHNYEAYLKFHEALCNDISRLDTGNEEIDNRRKNILRQGVNMIHYTLKTNLYQQNYTALSFRLDPAYLDKIPFDRSRKFPEMPFAIFFIKGMHYFGFHIRFQDLARGGLRTVYPERAEQILTERNLIFSECYHLALTQHLKNKDIPEGGAKGIIFLKPFERLTYEVEIMRQELLSSEASPLDVEMKLTNYSTDQKMEFLYQAQRSFVGSLITLVNCDPDGRIRAKNIVDYYKKPEYLYLGPDENMHDSMIQWIADTSKKYNYKPGSAFISGKPHAGINHKEYGVTSLGLNVYVEALLKYRGIDPYRNPFTVKMSGGPDGDVAGNEILNLYKLYPDTAKLIALIDKSGTIYEPKGLDLKTLSSLFHEGKPIRYYPSTLLSEGGFLLDVQSKRQDTSLSLQTLLWRNKGGKVVEEWLSSSEMNTLLKKNVHSVKADIFLPAGGRPKTLNESNLLDFLDETGKPTSHLIVEGANLYITAMARKKLEDLGVLIIKDSSANKTGVICSSFEVLSGLTIGDDLFIEYKGKLVQEILERLEDFASKEATLLLNTHKKTGQPLTEISHKISERINIFASQLRDYLEPLPLSENPDDPLIFCFLDFCLKTLRTQFQAQLLSEIPDSHKKAIIACHLAAELVYTKGLSWFPTIVDILPLALESMKSSFCKIRDLPESG